MSKRVRLLKVIKRYNYDIVNEKLANDREIKVLKDLNKRIEYADKQSGTHADNANNGGAREMFGGLKKTDKI